MVLISRCREKVAHRRSGTPTATAAADPVPQFLKHIAETLRHDAASRNKGKGKVPESAPPPRGASSAASLHGAELLHCGYTVDQVVRDYGDVCQVITGLAVEKRALITANEFRTLNLCLDDAIADAVSAFSSANQSTVDDNAEELQSQLNSYSVDQRRLLDIAIQCYGAIKSGNVGITGATGTLLIHALNELRAMTDRLPPEIGLAPSGSSATPTPATPTGKTRSP